MPLALVGPVLVGLVVAQRSAVRGAAPAVAGDLPGGPPGGEQHPPDPGSGHHR